MRRVARLVGGRAAAAAVAVVSRLVQGGAAVTAQRAVPLALLVQVQTQLLGVRGGEGNDQPARVVGGSGKSKR